MDGVVTTVIVEQICNVWMTVVLNMAMGNVKMGGVTVPMGTVVKVAVILCVAMPVLDMVSILDIENREVY